MEIERAIEILNPEHRECYENIEVVNEACRMGMQALERMRKMQTINIMLDSGAKMPTSAHESDVGINWNNCTCDVCGKSFHRKPSQILTRKRHYCSQACHYIGKREYMRGENNHQYGLKGAMNASWKSDEKESRYGYKQLYCPEHPFRDGANCVFEHRLVAEEYLLTDENSVEINGKKYLKPEYVVHHKDFDRKNNAPENLQVMTFAEHQSFHAKLNPRERDASGRFVPEQESIKVKRVTATAIIPERKTIGAAGFDLYADIDAPVIVRPHTTVMIYSGIAFSIPDGYFGAIYARSGLSVKSGLRPATCVSVIDSDYRGNVGLPMHNDTDTERVINPNERVAQIVFQKALTPKLEVVAELDNTERGDNGFGSSGR